MLRPRPRKRPTVPAVLLLIPARADPDHHPPPGERLRRRRHLGQMRGVAKAVAQHVVAHQFVRIARQRVHRHRPAFGHIMPVVLNMIGKPYRIERMDDLVEIGEKIGYMAGPRVDAHRDAHTCLLGIGARAAPQRCQARVGPGKLSAAGRIPAPPACISYLLLRQSYQSKRQHAAALAARRRRAISSTPKAQEPAGRTNFARPTLHRSQTNALRSL